MNSDACKCLCGWLYVCLSSLNTEAFYIKASREYKCPETSQLYFLSDVQQWLLLGLQEWETHFFLFFLKAYPFLNTFEDCHIINSF